jgi:hypothetical protein
VSEASAEHATAHITFEVGAHEVGQARALEAVLHGGVEGAQVLAHETVQGLAFRVPAGVVRAGG